MSPTPEETDMIDPSTTGGQATTHRPGLAELELGAVEMHHRRSSGTESTVVATPAGRSASSISEEKLRKDDTPEEAPTRKPLTGFRLVLLMVAMVSRGACLFFLAMFDSGMES